MSEERSKTGQELRALAREIERVLHESPCMSLANTIVTHCIDHLHLLAGFHEQQARAARDEATRTRSSAPPEA